MMGFLAAVPTASIVAAGALDSTDSTTGLVQYGALGIISAAALSALWWMVRQTLARSDRIEAENRELNRQVRDQVVPVLVSATEAIAEIMKHAEFMKQLELAKAMGDRRP